MNKTVNKNKSSRKLKNISIASAIVMCSTLSGGAHKASAGFFRNLFIRTWRDISHGFSGGSKVKPRRVLNIRLSGPNKGVEVVYNPYNPRYQIGNHNADKVMTEFYKGEGIFNDPKFNADRAKYTNW